MPPMGFKPTVSTGERPQTHALDRASTVIGEEICCRDNIKSEGFYTLTLPAL